jgi:ketosteroid isomerase-like protein
MKTKLVNRACVHLLIGLLAAVLIIVAGSSSALAGPQTNKKSKVKTNDQTDPNAPPITGSDADQIDHAISEMLAGFELGDVEMMHKHYSDNVTFVSGAYEPPIVGWQNYVPLFQRQRAAFQSMQLVRRNTIIFPHGDVAWAMYQWEFASLLNGQPYSMRGQTTLVFNKVGANWLIVHNHTSEIAATSAPPQQPAPQPAPAKP